MKRILITLTAVAALGAAYGVGYLVRSKTAPASAAPTKAERRIAYYYDPMHPAYKSDKPGIAPDCGMELVPMYADGGTGAAAATPTLNVSPEKQQQIGVETGYAERTSGTTSLRAVARVAVDETRVARVQSRVEGWVEHVNVDSTGRAVKQGETMLTIYSPEIVASQEEYLLALKAQETMRHASMAEMVSGGDELAAAARARLERHWRLDPATLAELERTHKVVRSVPLRAPASGFVLTRNALANQRVTPEMDLYTLADLRRVWIVADVAEADAGSIRVGAMASVETEETPARRFTARVTNILPQMDAQTRTLKVRLEAANDRMALRPDEFVNVEFQVSRPAHLTVNEDAVLDTGETRTVFLDRGNGVFEPRRVETGEHFNGRVEILKGLDAGERIATSGVFLLDSESKMRGIAPTPAPPAAPAAGPAAHGGTRMIDRVIEFSARHRFLVLAIVAALAGWGWHALKTAPLDALPDLSDTQVIVYSRWEQSPDIIEDQVTYPIITALLGAPKVRAVRGISDFGVSYVYIIFEDGTDLYWARTRTLEYLSSVLARLRKGVQTRTRPGCDRASAGSFSTPWWTRRASTTWRSCARCRTGICATNCRACRAWRRWRPRRLRAAVPGRTRSQPAAAYNIPIDKVVDAVRSGNKDVGGRLVEITGAEYMVRGRGYAQVDRRYGQHLARRPVNDGVPVCVRDVGHGGAGPGYPPRRGGSGRKGDASAGS